MTLPRACYSVLTDLIIGQGSCESVHLECLRSIPSWQSKDFLREASSCPNNAELTCDPFSHQTISSVTTFCLLLLARQGLETSQHEGVIRFSFELTRQIKRYWLVIEIPSKPKETQSIVNFLKEASHHRPKCITLEAKFGS